MCRRESRSPPPRKSSARSTPPRRRRVEWAAQNPQKRARVLLKFLELINKDITNVAKLLSSEHGKTVPDSIGDIQRGLEVVEFAAGAPHLLKGEYTTSAGTGIDVYSMRQPLGVVAGITPFNFPCDGAAVDVPRWRIACGNTFVLKPSERDPSPSPLRMAQLLMDAGLAVRSASTWCKGDKVAVDALIERRADVKALELRRLHAHRAVHLREGLRHNGKRVPSALGGAKNHMVVMPDADHRAGRRTRWSAQRYGSAGRALHGHQRSPCLVGKDIGRQDRPAKVAKRALQQLRRSADGDRTSTPRYGPIIIEGGAVARIEGLHRARRRRKAPSWSSTAAGSQGGRQREAASSLGGDAVRQRHARRCASTSEEIFGPVLVVRARPRIYESGACDLVERPRVRQRRRDLHPRRRHRTRLHRSSEHRDGRRQRAHPRADRVPQRSAAGRSPASAT